MSRTNKHILKIKCKRNKRNNIENSISCKTCKAECSIVPKTFRRCENTKRRAKEKSAIQKGIDLPIRKHDINELFW